MGRHKRAWTEEEIQLLKDSYPVYSPQQIGEKIGVASTTVRLKLDELGIPRINKKLRAWTEEELALCQEYPNKSIETIAGLVGVSPITLRRKLVQLGIQIIQRRNGRTGVIQPDSVGT
jgi:hypothetical protein